MENASKALLIAAAVLVVILIIAFGMTIMNSSSDTTSQVSEVGATQAVQSFNAKFQGYKGKINSDAARALKILVNNSNTNNPTHQVNLVEPADGIKDGGVYKVTMEYDTNGEYINKITLE